jgi:hypothetical protein
MKATVALLGRTWDFLLAFGLAVAAGLWLGAEAIGRVSADVVVFFGIQAAAILPAMIFAASVLRPDGLTTGDVTKYRKALRRQMGFWIAHLAINFGAALALIAGEAVQWKAPAPFSWMSAGTVAAPGFVGIAAFLAALAVLRSVSFISGVYSLMDLNGELTEKAVQARESAAAAHSTRSEPIAPFQPPPGFGDVARH